MFAFPKLLLLWTVFFMLTMALPMIFAPKKTIDVIIKAMKNLQILPLYAFIIMFFALFFLSVYQKLDGTWMMVFSIFGRLSLLKGLFILRFPSWSEKKTRIFYSTVPMIVSM